MSEPITPFEMVGDVDAGVCVDGVCTLPGAEVETSGTNPATDR
ncbi:MULTISPECIES: hypothetical protein [Mycobacteriales]|uniref:Uncharacterized protein n=1 Tax=Gordonia rubripertincta TaxID=36822 RepID=A0ABT4N5W2_GORRU|nr:MULTISPECIES: hypothetical protein [Mycobacteriales]MCZ4553756.1 hypothetical protein [Gordonia rubripertincta]